MSMHCKSFHETWLTFEMPTSIILLLFSVVICLSNGASNSMIFENATTCALVYVYQLLKENKILLGEENLLVIQFSVCYILKQLEDRKAWSVHIYYILLIFKVHRRTRPMPRFSIHRLKIRTTSHPWNEQITLSYLLKIKETIFDDARIGHKIWNKGAILESFSSKGETF